MRVWRGPTIVIALLTILLVPVPPATAGHVPLLRWDWCLEEACLSDEGSLAVSGNENEPTVDFAGYLGSAYCTRSGDTIRGALAFPHDLAPSLVSTTAPCTDVWLGYSVLLDLPEIPELGLRDICDVWGGVGADTALGTLTGRFSYIGYCPEE